MNGVKLGITVGLMLGIDFGKTVGNNAGVFDGIVLVDGCDDHVGLNDEYGFGGLKGLRLGTNVCLLLGIDVGKADDNKLGYILGNKPGVIDGSELGDKRVDKVGLNDEYELGCLEGPRLGINVGMMVGRRFG